MKRLSALLLTVAFMLSGCAGRPSVPESSYVTKVPSGTESVVPPAAVDGIRVKIALIDTGVSTKAIDSQHILSGHNYVTGAEGTEDQLNHGTAVASVILGCESAEVTGMTPDAYLVPLVIMTKQDGDIAKVSPDILAQAIRDSIDVYQADIINVSLGIQKDHPALRDAVAYADSEGVPVISAVGNGGIAGKPYYPAAYDTVLAVGSCDRNGKVSSFSQSGAEVFATGEGVMLASRNGVPYGIKGTSFATGFVSAHAAKLLAEKPALTPKELYSKIIEKAASNGGYLPLQ